MWQSNQFFIMKGFPDFQHSGFDIHQYNKTFEKKNVIISASAKNVSYKEHWGPLSVKCVIKGVEHYQCSNRFYSVDKDTYLIFNDGQYYSSHIYSTTETESFTINFSSEFQKEVLHGFINNIDEENNNSNVEFIEKIYTHNNVTTAQLKNLHKLSLINNPDMLQLSETYHSLLTHLLFQQSQLKKEIKKIKAVKFSTQIEIYKRLTYAKDFIHSCYMKEIGLNDLATVACMNSAHFLREFKKYFGLTPYQYIMRQRLHAAKNLLQTTSCSINEICFEVGYSDITSFSKLFKKYFSVTPATCRSMQTKKSFFTN